MWIPSRAYLACENLLTRKLSGDTQNLYLRQNSYAIHSSERDQCCVNGITASPSCELKVEGYILLTR